MRPAILDPLFRNVSALTGVGEKLERLLGRFLRKDAGDTALPARIIDLLFHVPVASIDRRQRFLIADLPESGIVSIEVTVGGHRPPPPNRRQIPYRVLCFDETGQISLVFFRAYPDHLKRILPEGETRMISGLIERYQGQPQMSHPHHVLTPEAFEKLPPFEPVYPLTQGLTGKTLSKSISSALRSIPDLPEWQDPTWIEQNRWPRFSQALHKLHIPQTAEDIAPDSVIRSRLAFDELLANQLALSMVRRHLRRGKSTPIRARGDLRAKIIAGLPYQLTGSQQQASEEILADLASPHRMMRLLLGDVGSGKTIVALLALAQTIEAGHQGAFMVPTEILARQHLASLQQMAETAGIGIEILTGRERGLQRDDILKRLKAGQIDLLIGTHALFQSGVEFADLKLAIIDEQHRFGVQQRLALQQKAGGDVNLLVMTATPIPRTLTLTFYGDMDVSKLTDKPAGRQAIDTRTIPKDRMDEVMAGLDRALAANQQVYWICPLVEENDELQLSSAQKRFAVLEARLNHRIGLVHGRMRGSEKDDVMQAFQRGEIRLLVATTVVEVGVDVPNASIMIIEHAEHFGLAQLHQLRGRVGRGAAKSSCILLYKEPLNQTARDRLQILRQSQDGFYIAEEDLRLRGAGEVLGTRQSGLQQFRLAELAAHADLLAAARDDVAMILRDDPLLLSQRGEALRMLLYLFSRDDAIRLLQAG